MSEVPNVEGSTNAPVQGSTTPSSPTGSSSGYSNDTKIGSLEDLKEKAPEVHKAMMDGIAQGIIKKMKASQERLKKMWDESRRQD